MLTRARRALILIVAAALPAIGAVTPAAAQKQTVAEAVRETPWRAAAEGEASG